MTLRARWVTLRARWVTLRARCVTLRARCVTLTAHQVFEAIDKLEFQEDLTVTAMYSEETEKVAFKTTFNPKSAGGNVEKWLIECEDAMRESMQDITFRAYGAYAKTKRDQWILEWPGQVVLCVSQMFWTKEVEQAIRGSTLAGYAEKCTAQLGDIVNKVRRAQKPWVQKERKALLNSHTK